MRSAQNSTHKRQRPNPSAASAIQVSTPPVRIIGAERRHKGGFHLSDR